MTLLSDKACEMARSGMSMKQVREALIRSGAGTVHSREAAKHARDIGLFSNKHSHRHEGVTYLLKHEEALSPTLAERAEVERNRRASVMHLVDLKRAGHSPRKTEFRISPDLETEVIKRRTSAILYSSIYGSTSALCAELGG